MKSWITAAALALGLYCTAYADDGLKAAIAAAQRTPAFVARDAWRHPYETQQFFGLRPEMTVVEITPGAGWYTEILAPYLRSAGFKLAGASELNANPKDGADHPGGVWALPPTYADKDKERARFAAIGESDRFTLRFVKA